MQMNRRDFTLLDASAAAAAALPEVLHAQAANDAVTSLTLAEVAAKIRSKALTSAQVTEACLSRIDTYNPKLSAFITIMNEPALAQARQLDADLKAGKPAGPLHGVPVCIKDNTDTAGTRTTGASALFADRVPKEDAPVVARLKAAGAIIIGKTNLHEFAAGAGNASYWGSVRNPWNLGRATGGSSSGTGSAVSSELCFAGTGTDTAGSVRHPAAYCGIVGLKVTAGLVPIRGIMPLAATLDTCGPLARTCEDAALMLNAMAGYDKLDIMSADHAKEDYVAGMKQPVSSLRIGLPIGHFDQVDPEIMAAFNTALDVLRTLTAGAKDCTLPNASLAMSVGTPAEFYAWHEDYYKAQPNKYQPTTRVSLDTGSTALAASYIRGTWEIERLRRIIDDSFQSVDLIAFPTMHTMPGRYNAGFGASPTAPGTGSTPVNPALRPASGISDSQLMNVFGLPAISIPCGFSKDGMPIGLEIAGPHFSESRILALAQRFQDSTQWHTMHPTLTPDMPVPA